MGVPNDRAGESDQQSVPSPERVISGVSFDAEAKLQAHFDARLKPPARQQRELTSYLHALEAQASEHEFLDLDLARQLTRKCEDLLDLINDDASEQTRRLVQMAVSYFIDTHDAEDDADSPIGFDDDAEVIRLVAGELGVSRGGDA